MPYVTTEKIVYKLSLILFGLYISLLVACGNNNLEAAKKALNKILKDPSSAQYQNVTVYKYGVVCGEINAKNSMGGYTGFTRFIYTPQFNEAVVDVPNFVIPFYCNNNDTYSALGVNAAISILSMGTISRDRDECAKQNYDQMAPACIRVYKMLVPIKYNDGPAR